MTTPASHRRTPTRPDYFPPVPAGAIPVQRRPEAGVHRARAGSGRDRTVAGVALLLAAGLGAGWLLLGPSGQESFTAIDRPAGLDGDSPRITGQIPLGTFDVRHQLESGVYRTAGAAGTAGCTWQLTGATGPLVDGGTSTGPASVTIRSGAEFTSIGCQDWVRMG